MNQKKDIVKTTNVLGIIPPVKNEFSTFELYEDDYSYPSIVLKKIKIWTGKPVKTKPNFPKCLLGFQFWYVNFFTGEKKDSDYVGCELKGDDIGMEELEVQDNDYFNKINIDIYRNKMISPPDLNIYLDFQIPDLFNELNKLSNYIQDYMQKNKNRFVFFENK